MDKLKKGNASIEENIQEELEQTKTIAKQLLRKIGVKVHLSGFKYWTTALLIIKENELKEESKISMMKLYDLIAKKHKTTGSKVEKAMRFVYEKLDLKQQFNVNYPINNTALLFLLKEEVDDKLKNVTKK